MWRPPPTEQTYRQCSPVATVRASAGHVALMLVERLGEHIPTSAVGEEIEFPGRRIGGGFFGGSLRRLSFSAKPELFRQANP